MNLIARVRSPGPQKPLGDVLRVPLGIDVWEVKPDHLILRGTEAQLDRLSSMGYLVEQLEDVARHLSAFARAEAAEQYHSAASMEEELRQLAEARPDIAELKEIGRSIEGRPILALRIGDRRGGVPKLLFMGCHHAREWIAVEVPFLLAKELVERADEAPIAGWLTSGEVWVAPMVNPDGHEHSRSGSAALAQEPPAERRRLVRRRPEPQLWLHVGHSRRAHLQPRAERRDLRRPARFLRAGDAGGPRPRRVRTLRRRDHLPQLLAAHSLSLGLHGDARCRTFSTGSR